MALCLIYLLVTEKTPGVIRAATQYGTASRVMDLATFDVTHNPWRCGELFDAIVTDPPCTFTTFINFGARILTFR
jgi:hypothetical protein